MVKKRLIISPHGDDTDSAGASVAGPRPSERDKQEILQCVAGSRRVRVGISKVTYGRHLVGGFRIIHNIEEIKRHLSGWRVSSECDPSNQTPVVTATRNCLYFVSLPLVSFRTQPTDDTRLAATAVSVSASQSSATAASGRYAWLIRFHLSVRNR